MEKLYKVQMNSKGMPNFSTAVEVADRPQDDDFKNFDRESLILLIECQKERIGELLADRQQGEWIRTGRTNIYGGIEVQCSNCNDKVMVQHLEDEWYCRHCGADMGMKGADDE